ncbi:MAG: TolC family protein [bacterium]|nr:TolC family protein [bacterium]
MSESKTAYPGLGESSRGIRAGGIQSRGIRAACIRALVLAALLPVLVAAEEPSTGPLDLTQVVGLALARNPALQTQVERRAEVAGGVKEVAADAWPQLDLVGSWSRARNPALLNSPDFEDIVEQFPDFEPGEQELWDVGLELTQTLYSGGKVRAAVDLAELVVGITEAQIETAELEAALNAAEAYYRLLQAESALETVEVQQKARQRSLEVVEVRYELGDATRLELLRARSALTAVEPAVARIRGRVDVEKSRLRVALGLDFGTEIEGAPVAGELPEPPSLAGLLNLAREQRPELEDLALQTEALGRQRVVTAADGKPQVELATSYGRQVRLVDDFGDPLFDNWGVSLALTWSLFDGGRRRGELLQLESRRRQLDWQRRDLVNEIASEIEEALVAYRTSRERLRAAEAAAEVAREASRVALESYREGVAIQADLLGAQEQEIQAEFVRVEAVYEAWVLAARLLRSIGRLPTETWEDAG